MSQMNPKELVQNTANYWLLDCTNIANYWLLYRFNCLVVSRNPPIWDWHVRFTTVPTYLPTFLPTLYNNPPYLHSYLPTWLFIYLDTHLTTYFLCNLNPSGIEWDPTVFAYTMHYMFVCSIKFKPKANLIPER